MGYISVGPVLDLTYVQSESIKSVKSIESDNSRKPYCINIEFHNGKSKQVYFITEDDEERNLKKIRIEMQKVLKFNNFQSTQSEIPKVKKLSKHSS